MISSALEKVLELQSSYSPLASPQMIERRILVETTLCNLLRDLVRTSPSLQGLEVDASSGKGNNALVPWLRVFDPSTAPSAQSGWYLVFLFSGDGSRVVLSLGLGITGSDQSEIVLKKKSAQSLLAASGQWGSDEYSDHIDLRAKGNSLASKYESGTLLCIEFLKDHIPNDEDIKTHLESLARKLLVINDETKGTAVNKSERTEQLEPIIKGLNWDPGVVRDVLQSLAGSAPQVVFTGPPGTGKTYAAQKFAEHVTLQANSTVDLDDVRLIQFHPSYGYEEFVEGLRPVPAGTGGIIFDTVPGVITELAQKIQRDGRTRVLIIDEMNRANLPRVFGELLYLLEYRDRTINLMLSKSFQLSKKLLIIGTMNTADKSIKSIDAALRRRFEFYSIEPSEQALIEHYIEARNELGSSLYTGFRLLNERLRTDVGESGYEIGHSYFMRDLMNREVLQKIWMRQISPLLSDYFGDRLEVLQNYSVDVFWPKP